MYIYLFYSLFFSFPLYLLVWFIFPLYCTQLAFDIAFPDPFNIYANCYFFFRIIQPLALGQLIAYYIPNQTAISEQAAYLYAGGVILCSLANVFVNHPFMMGMLHLGMKMRVACCSLIYRKALKLSKTALRETTAGQVVNLLSNDVNRFDIAVLFAHQLWVGPLQTILVTYFMYEQVGVSAVIGVLFLLMFIPLQSKYCLQTRY